MRVFWFAGAGAVLVGARRAERIGPDRRVAVVERMGRYHHPRKLGVHTGHAGRDAVRSIVDFDEPPVTLTGQVLSTVDSRVVSVTPRSWSPSCARASTPQ